MRFAGVIERLERALNLSLGLDIAFVDDDEMRQYNRDYRGKDQTTDVLSFACWDGEAMPGDEALLGSILISLDAAKRQARMCGHALSVEVAVLLAHGIAHLVGYDHERSRDEALQQASFEMQLLDASGFAPASALIHRSL